MQEENKKSLRERIIAAREQNRADFKAAELKKASSRMHEYIDTLESRVEKAVDMIRDSSLEEKDVMREIGENLSFIIAGIRVSPMQVNHNDLMALSGYRRLHSFCSDPERDIACYTTVERMNETSLCQLKIEISVDMPYSQSRFTTSTLSQTLSRGSVPEYTTPEASLTEEDANVLILEAVANHRARGM